MSGTIWLSPEASVGNRLARIFLQAKKNLELRWGRGKFEVPNPDR